MEITACPQCGSQKIYQGTMGDGVLTGYTSRNVCRDCGYRGMPFIFDSEKEYKKFLDGISNDRKDGYKDFKEKININEKQILQAGRPLSVTILSLVMIIEAVFALCIYYYVIGFENAAWYWIYYLIVFLISAVILPYGLLKGRGWAWTIGAMLFALSIPIGLIFLYYLTRPHVRKYFGKSL